MSEDFEGNSGTQKIEARCIKQLQKAEDNGRMQKIAAKPKWNSEDAEGNGMT